MTGPRQFMRGEEWHIDVFLAHCLFETLERLKGDYEENQNFLIWYHTLVEFAKSYQDRGAVRARRGLTVAPAESDIGFFQEIIEDELDRLSAYAPDTLLVCGETVGEHAESLRKWLQREVCPP